MFLGLITKGFIVYLLSLSDALNVLKERKRVCSQKPENYHKNEM